MGSEYLSPSFNGNMANVSEMGQKITARLGCHKAEDILAAMRTRSAQEWVEAADCKTDLFDDEALFLRPSLIIGCFLKIPWRHTPKDARMMCRLLSAAH